MDKLPPSDNGEKTGADNVTPVFLRVGGNKWEEAPSGEYRAVCTKIISDFYGRKLAIYFVVIEGKHAGKRTRLFYNKLPKDLAEKMGTDFGAGSKFYSDMKKLFPGLIGDGSTPIEIDVNQLFLHETFIIQTELRGKAKEAIVQSIEHDVGF